MIHKLLVLTMQVLEACVDSGALRGSHTQGTSGSLARNPAIARLQAEDAGSVGSHASSGFGGVEFWDALRQVRPASYTYLHGVLQETVMSIFRTALCVFSRVCRAGENS